MTSRLFTSESVTEGHPDKMADQISDGVLDAILRQDPKARVIIKLPALMRPRLNDIAKAEPAAVLLRTTSLAA